MNQATFHYETHPSASLLFFFSSGGADDGACVSWRCSEEEADDLVSRRKAPGFALHAALSAAAAPARCLTAR